jgi:glycyl-tRNA synthetase beta chain
MFAAGDYESALLHLSVLRKPVDDFFDNVMVMTDNIDVRNNRIALLSKMDTLFMRAADLSRLHQL